MSSTESRITVNLTQHHIKILDKYCEKNSVKQRFNSRSEAVRRALELLDKEENGDGE